MKKIAIIILNWNGWKDTCECIASVQLTRYRSNQIIIIDNGSEDDSIIKIQSFLMGKLNFSIGPFQVDSNNSKQLIKVLTLEEFVNSTELKKKDALLISSDENLGFAKACNYGIDYAIRNGFEYTFLLNNDTTVEANCLDRLCDFIETHKEYPIISPIIYYYDNPEVIWNFGGKLTFTGRRSIFMENQKANDVKEYSRDISFISGCAFFAKTDVFIKYGLLSERFFFGEEDYEFSWRMKDKGVRMSVISEAKVYHKVSMSNKRLFSENRLPYIFIGYLNRFIDRKIHERSKFCYNTWRLICCMYITPKLMIIHRHSINHTIKLLFLLIQYSTKYDYVDQTIFYDAKKVFN